MWHKRVISSRNAVHVCSEQFETGNRKSDKMHLLTMQVNTSRFSVNTIVSHQNNTEKQHWICSCNEHLYKKPACVRRNNAAFSRHWTCDVTCSFARNTIVSHVTRDRKRQLSTNTKEVTTNANLENFQIVAWTMITDWVLFTLYLMTLSAAYRNRLRKSGKVLKGNLKGMCKEAVCDLIWVT